ncbi:hypothetical protein PENSPDRAFT_722673 [Peniophora sp. CONT]|nr:hypothetical protein PENSPDRAFT_722673 [Peniophora sp. CONT]
MTSPTASAPTMKPAQTDGPVPLSFPAFLRNPALQSRFAQLSDSGTYRAKSAPAVAKRTVRRDENDGKRWVRRKENSRFEGNPHVVAPTKRDLTLTHPAKAETFPIPLPPFLPRSVSLPATTAPTPNQQNSRSGNFSMSLRGARKNIRRAGPRTQALVRAVEEALTTWIAEGAAIVKPDAPAPEMAYPGTLIGDVEGVYEVQRMHDRLVWCIQDDAWSRYVVHCCARYLEVVSFSGYLIIILLNQDRLLRLGKDTPEHRLTYLLRPNNTRLRSAVMQSLETPPATDPELSSAYDSDIIDLSDIASGELSDIASVDGLSDVDAPPSASFAAPAPLSAISSDNEADVESDLGSIASLYHAARRAEAWDTWSQSDGEELPEAMRGLAIEDDTPRARRIAPLRTSTWDRARSGSSPSPARRERRLVRRGKRRNGAKVEVDQAGKSFYDYIFN